MIALITYLFVRWATQDYCRDGFHPFKSHRKDLR